MVADAASASGGDAGVWRSRRRMSKIIIWQFHDKQEVGNEQTYELQHDRPTPHVSI